MGMFTQMFAGLRRASCQPATAAVLASAFGSCVASLALAALPARASFGAEPPAKSSAPAPSNVVVSFVKPESFTDAGISNGYETDKPEDVLHALKGHLESLGQHCLASGQVLAIRVTDVRLAGEVEWPRRRFDYQPVRVMREVTWPEIDLEYELRDASDRVVRQGSNRVSDPAYLQGSRLEMTGMDRLPYETNMLSRWYEQTFCAGQRSG